MANTSGLRGDPSAHKRTHDSGIDRGRGKLGASPAPEDAREGMVGTRPEDADTFPTPIDEY